MERPCIPLAPQSIKKPGIDTSVNKQRDQQPEPACFGERCLPDTSQRLLLSRWFRFQSHRFASSRLLEHSTLENLFRRAKELCRLYTHCCTRWTGLYTRLIFVSHTEITFNRYLLAYLIIASYLLSNIKWTRSSTLVVNKTTTCH